MAGLVGKHLGKVTFVCEESPPGTEPRRFKYPGKWYRIRCECGTEKLIPRQGSVGYRSCGCAQFERNRTTANETIRYFPSRVEVEKEMIYPEI